MASYSMSELRDAYETFARVSDECAASADYNAFADLYTEDCLYIEHAFGEMHGREAVREWIVPLMKEYPANQMTYSHDWVVIDEENSRVFFCGRTHMPDLGDGRDYSTTNWTRIDYAGGGLWSREEDIYNPAHFATLIAEWQAAKDGDVSGSVLDAERPATADALDEFWSLFNEGRLEEATALCTSDFEYIDVQNFPDPLDAEGFRAAMQQVLDAAPDRRVTIDRRFDGGHGSGVLETTWRGTFTGADDVTTSGLVIVFDTVEGQIRRQRAYYG